MQTTSIAEQAIPHGHHKPLLAVIGGGAAGFFCAVNAARLNTSLQVMIVEKSNKLLSKVKVSGGGRCNVTHDCNEVNELVLRYPRGRNFLKKTFHWFNAEDTVNWFAERGVALTAEPDGRMFPISNDSQTIVDCLLKEATKYNVEVRMHFDVKEIQTGNGFLLTAADGSTLHADALCIACGGFPKPAQFNWLNILGHTIVSPVPSLFTFNIPQNAITKLMGVSVASATVKVTGTKLRETGPLLITHWGLSGPVVLRLSAWGARELAAANYEFNILVNWLPGCNEQTLREEWNILRARLSAQDVGNKNPFQLPARLWLYLLDICSVPHVAKWAELTARQQLQLIQSLTALPLQVKGKTTFKEEFVTCGGIALQDIEVNTMESRKQPGLYFAGEVMDVDGITGGFNFQHAWTSGFIAAKAIAGKYVK